MESEAERLCSKVMELEAAVTTWFNACTVKDKEYGAQIRDLRQRNDVLWQEMNQTRALLGRLRTRAAAGENLTVPLENELGRLHNILKRARKLDTNAT